jgi:hypothetical protein
MPHNVVLLSAYFRDASPQTFLLTAALKQLFIQPYVPIHNPLQCVMLLNMLASCPTIAPGHFWLRQQQPKSLGQAIFVLRLNQQTVLFP